ncbi:Phytanoyl-CoA dioxygenase [Deinococcus saxicola]|uniref:phytanoyl-CoA dioxygenase family protein n=1 Tax=Deinococcus saxicola TaxID=249406 RepID=UPI0039F062EF
MTTAPQPKPEPAAQYDVAGIMGAIYSDGITGFKEAFSREWVAQLGEDLTGLYQQALARPSGAVGRGTNRHYVEIHPEDIRGFVELVGNPWIHAVCEAVLGPQYQFVEIGFDVPNPGARDQPWHRDFPATAQTLVERRLNSLAFNLTTVDVEPDMGPFEIAPGTQWDDPSSYDHGMFPPTSLYGRYQARSQLKMPRMGDVSVRSALTIHRGTANQSNKPRPVLVLGVDAPGAGNHEKHDFQMTRRFYDSLPASLREHLLCRLVDQLEPVVQGHTIEGLMMGDA